MYGNIQLIIGPMFSGKTTELLNRYDRFTIGGKKCLMVKYNNDDRYGSSHVVTHNDIKIEAISCSLLEEVDSDTSHYDVICVDEVQFYKDAHTYCDKWANEGKIVVASGLNGTYQRKEFKIISQLIPLAEDIQYKTAICRETGNDAHYSYLLKDGKGKEEIIGGTDLYKAVDRETYFKYINS